ncbi:MAG: hypothetical protein HQ521_20770 [Bacteroidetes bacterium]|nr:hypothetical protein [Bacteroidota bacterium]
MISDLILSLFAIYIFTQIRKYDKKWGAFYLFMSLSAFVGGIHHGFPIIGEEFRFLSWVFLSTSLIYAQLAAYSDVNNKTLKFLIIVKSTSFLFLAFLHSNFIFMILDTAISMLGFIVIGNLLYLKSLSRFITYGILVSLTSVFFVVYKISFSNDYLNYNDIGHYISILSLILISKGIKRDYSNDKRNLSLQRL